MNVACLHERWIAERFAGGEINAKSRRGLSSRLRTLDPVCGHMEVTQVDREVIRRWWRTVGHNTAATRRLYLSTVGCFFRWAIDEGLITEDPTEHLPRVREPRTVPRARHASEVSRILTVAVDPRDQLIVWMMVEMGLRCVEVSRAELADYDHAGATLLVRGKAGHERTLPVPAPAAAAIDAYRDLIGWRAGPLVCSMVSRRQGIGPEQVSKIVSGLMSAAGVKRRPGDGVTPYSLRHTAASDVLDRCGNVRTVQVMLGHASLNTTAIYLRKASLEQLREAMSGRTYESVTK
jgi:site-specific recombinase XerD